MGPNLGTFLYVNVSDQACTYVSSLCAENKSCKIYAISPGIEYYDPVKDKPINKTSQIIFHSDKLEVNSGK